jgi:Ca-activated chloride channel homolog
VSRMTLRKVASAAGLVLLAVALVGIPLWWDHATITGRGDFYRFRWPWVLLGLVGAAALLVPVFWVTRRTVTRWRWPLGRLAAFAPRSWRARLRRLPPTLRCAALGLCVLALARPQGSRDMFETTSEGIDIVVALDMSGSMNEADMFPNRFEAEKEVVREFVEKRPDDRIGLVVFGSRAYPLAPLTADHRLLDGMLRDLRLEHMPESMQNTAIGDALASALARLEASDADSRVVILVTDGMDNESDIDPLDAAAEAHRQGVKVFTILLGLQGEVLAARGVDMLGRPIRAGAPQQFPTDPELLKKIAARTDGAFFEASRRDDLEKAFHGILDVLRKTEHTSRVELADERFEFFLWCAGILLALEYLMRHVWLRELA